MVLRVGQSRGPSMVVRLFVFSDYVMFAALTWREQIVGGADGAVKKPKTA
jgi:hypothetical protein